MSKKGRKKLVDNDRVVIISASLHQSDIHTIRLMGFGNFSKGIRVLLHEKDDIDIHTTPIAEIVKQDRDSMFSNLAKSNAGARTEDLRIRITPELKEALNELKARLGVENSAQLFQIMLEKLAE